MFKHALCLCSAVALAAASAAAQEPAPAPSPPPSETPSPAPTQSNEEAPQALPLCPPGQEALPPCPQPSAAPPVVEEAKPEKRHNMVFAPTEVSLMAGAGASNYFGSGHTTNTDVGAGWDARVLFGAHSVIALEAGYAGAFNSIDSNGTNRGHITSNGFDGTFRLQLPYVVQPYIFGGVGYNHMSVDSGGSTTLALRQAEDNQIVIPAGGGISAYLGGHFTLDVRGTYRYIPDNEITAMNTSALHQWGGQARIGWTF
jgi:hypothetical protein